MLAVLVYLTEIVRRMARKTARSIAIIAASYRDAQEARRTLPRVYMEE